MFPKISLISFLLFFSCSSNTISNNNIRFDNILDYYISLTDRNNEYIGISSINDFDNSNRYLIMITIGNRKICETETYKNADVYLKDDVLIVLVKNNILNNTFFNLKNKIIKKNICFKEIDSIYNNDVGREALILRFDENYNFLNVYSPYYEVNYIDKDKTDKLLKSISR